MSRKKQEGRKRKEITNLGTEQEQECWRNLRVRASGGTSTLPRLLLSLNRHSGGEADAQENLRSWSNWSSWSDAHSSGVRTTCRSSRGRNGGSWKRRNEILKKFDIVQCSPNWGTDSTSLIILNCAPGLPGKDREGWKSEKLNICWLAQGAVARGKLWEERHMPLAGWWEVNKLEVDSDRLNFNFYPRYGTWQQHEVNNNNK